MKDNIKWIYKASFNPAKDDKGNNKGDGDFECFC